MTRTATRMAKALLESRGLRVVSEREDDATAGTGLRLDAWQNPVTGLGTARDKTAYNQFAAGYQLNDLQLSGIYHDSDLAARMVDVVPDEMFREGFDVDLGDQKLNTEVGEQIEALGLVTKLADGVRWGRLFGGGGVLLGADDGRSASSPLKPEMAQALSYVYVLDRRYLWPLTYYRESGHPKLGQPETFMVSSPTSWSQTPVAVVHESRLVLFGGATTGIREREVNQGWDLSVLQRTNKVLGDFDLGWQSVLHLLADGNQGVFKMSGLAEAIAAPNGEALLKKRLEMLDFCRSIVRAIVVDAGDVGGEAAESFERHNFPLTGIPDVLDKLMLRLAAAVQIPVTILMGQSPAGMNATGESDFRWFYSRIKSEQTRRLAPKIRRIIKVMLATKQFARASQPTIKITFPSLWDETPLAKAQTRQAILGGDQIAITTGMALPEELALKRFQPDGFESEFQISPEGIKAREAALKGELERLEEGPPEPLPPGQPGGGGAPFGGSPPAGEAPADADDPGAEEDSDERTDGGEDQPRDELGRFGETNGGGGGTGGGGRAAKAQARLASAKARLESLKEPERKMRSAIKAGRAKAENAVKTKTDRLKQLREEKKSADREASKAERESDKAKDKLVTKVAAERDIDLDDVDDFAEDLDLDFPSDDDFATLASFHEDAENSRSRLVELEAQHVEAVQYLADAEKALAENPDLAQFRDKAKGGLDVAIAWRDEERADLAKHEAGLHQAQTDIEARISKLPPEAAEPFRRWNDAVQRSQRAEREASTVKEELQRDRKVAALYSKADKAATEGKVARAVELAGSATDESGHENYEGVDWDPEDIASPKELARAERAVKAHEHEVRRTAHRTDADDDQPRDEAGRFASTDGGDSSSGGGGTAKSAAGAKGKALAKARDPNARKPKSREQKETEAKAHSEKRIADIDAKLDRAESERDRTSEALDEAKDAYQEAARQASERVEDAQLDVDAHDEDAFAEPDEVEATAPDVVSDARQAIDEAKGEVEEAAAVLELAQSDLASKKEVVDSAQADVDDPSLPENTEGRGEELREHLREQQSAFKEQERELARAQAGHEKAKAALAKTTAKAREKALKARAKDKAAKAAAKEKFEAKRAKERAKLVAKVDAAKAKAREVRERELGKVRELRKAATAAARAYQAAEDEQALVYKEEYGT